MRYEVHPLAVWQSAYRARMGATAKVSYRVVDTHTVRHSPRDGVRAWSYDEAVVRQICDMLNGVNLHASHWQAEAHKWQGCLDMANRNAAAARADADRVRNQLFEAREQRDEARADARNAWAELKKQPNGGFCTGSITVYNEHREPETIVSILDRVQKAEAGEVKMRLEAARALTERDELRKALKASHREIAEARHYWANQGPHEHVVISLAGYNKLVTERDEQVALAGAGGTDETEVLGGADPLQAREVVERRARDRTG